MERKNRGNKVFVGLSGGVDSSVAALLLQKEGYDVTGVFIRSYNLDGCAERDAADARLVANKLGIHFYVFDFEKEYKREVVDYMVRGYREGRTPNPDVMCNKHIKFGLFLKKARDLGAAYIATGHYVRKIGDALAEARDKNKDQSYFLWALNPEQIKYSLFPIGDHLKPEVRAIAKKAGLPTAEKKDSQGICFLGKVALEDFLKDFIPVKRGVILTTEGQAIGEHQGAQFYTIGQRHGLDLKEKNAVLGLKTRAKTLPHYVAEKDTSTNTIIVAEGDRNPALYKDELTLNDVNLNEQARDALRAKGSVTVFARVRYRQPLGKAKLVNHGAETRLVFDRPQKFVAPGQSAVFYGRTGVMLGGGVIL